LASLRPIDSPVAPGAWPADPGSIAIAT